MKKTFILIALLLAFSPITQAAETADTTTTAEPVSFIGSWGAPDDSAGDAVEASARHPFKGDRFSLEKAKEYDTDGDGALSDTEKEAMKAAIKAEMETKKAEMLAKYDTDGDGSLSDTEKTAMHEAIKAERDARKAELLTKYDADGDGSLSDTEKATMKEAMKAEMEAKLLEKFDADGDGTLSDSEKATMEKSRPQRGGGHRCRPGDDGEIDSEGDNDRPIPQELLTKYDTDNDGTLSDTEKTAMQEAMKTEHETRKAEMLTKYDADGDGTLSDTERQTMDAARKTEMESKMLEKYDADGDGTLSDSEKSTMESSRPQKGKGRGPGGKGGPKGPPPGMKNRR